MSSSTSAADAPDAVPWRLGIGSDDPESAWHYEHPVRRSLEEMAKECRKAGQARLFSNPSHAASDLGDQTPSFRRLAFRALELAGRRP